MQRHCFPKGTKLWWQAEDSLRLHLKNPQINISQVPGPCSANQQTINAEKKIRLESKEGSVNPKAWNQREDI